MSGAFQCCLGFSGTDLLWVVGNEVSNSRSFRKNIWSRLVHIVWIGCRSIHSQRWLWTCIGVRSFRSFLSHFKFNAILAIIVRGRLCFFTTSIWRLSLFFCDDKTLLLHSLYYLSNVRPNKFVAKFLAIGRMDVVITRLRTTLSEPEGRVNTKCLRSVNLYLYLWRSGCAKASMSPYITIWRILFFFLIYKALSVNERKNLSNILLQCYLQRILQTKNHQVNFIYTFVWSTKKQ